MPANPDRLERQLGTILSQRETKLDLFREEARPVEKNLGEQSRKLANFVRHPKLLITKVSADEWPGVP